MFGTNVHLDSRMKSDFGGQRSKTSLAISEKFTF